MSTVNFDNAKSIDMSNVLGLLGIYLSLKNLELNLTQSDKQEMLDDMDKKLSLVLLSIEEHLERQDELLSKIGECVKNDNR